MSAGERRKASGMAVQIEYLIAGALIMLVVIGVVYAAVLLAARRRKRVFDPEQITRAGARLVSKARYRGRRVFHYSDGGVVAETKHGFKPFESFDAYRYHVDRR